MTQILMAFLGFLIVPKVIADVETNSVYAKAKEVSDIVVECEVVDEGPLGHGSSIQKSYRVKRKAVFWSVVGWKLPETLWIHYDSNEYPQVLRSGHETGFHKGDRFVAFLDFHEERKGWEFQVVRLELASNAKEIEKELKSTGSGRRD